MNKTLLILILIMSAFFLIVSEISQAASSMRCGRTAIISKGDSLGEVLSACGDPVTVRSSSVYRTQTSKDRNSRYSSYSNNDYSNTELLADNRSLIEIPVETWTYNFGPKEFMREITFIAGEVDSVKTLGYGH